MSSPWFLPLGALTAEWVMGRDQESSDKWGQKEGRLEANPHVELFSEG